jgi:AtzH-like
MMDATFWDSPHTIRYAFHENGNSFAQIHAHRVARPPGPGTKEKRIRLEILTLGRDLATVNLEFKVRGQDVIGRQSQTWVRFPGRPWLEGCQRARLGDERAAPGLMDLHRGASAPPGDEPGVCQRL